MPDLLPRKSTKVALEDLLRLKNAERPPAGFWTEFERELRQKQLAALVVRKSWWHSATAAFNGTGRLQVTAGAAAALVLTFVSFHYYQTGDESRLAPGNRLESSAPAESSSRASSDASFSPLGALVGENASPNDATMTDTRVSEETALPREQTLNRASEVAAVDLAKSGASGEGGAPRLTPSARSIAANLAAAAAIEPEVFEANVRLATLEDLPVPVARARHAAEELPTAAAIADSRRTRLPVAVLLEGSYAPEPAAPEYAINRTIRYLTQGGLDDRKISRLVPQGDRLSIKL